VLLSEKPHAIDHLLSAFAGGGEALGQTGVLTLEELHALRGDDALDSRRLEGLESRLRLQRATSKRSELVAQVLDQLLELRERGSFRSYAV
jgi:superfamily II helicase